MRTRSFLFLIFCLAFINAKAQDYWNRKDFRIDLPKTIPSLSKGFFQEKTFGRNFNLASGQYLDMPQKKRTVNVISYLERAENIPEKQMDLGFRVHEKKEEKAFQISGKASRFNENSFNSPFNPNSFSRNYKDNNQNDNLYFGSYYTPVRRFRY